MIRSIIALQLAAGITVALLVYWALTVDCGRSQRALASANNRSSREDPGQSLAPRDPQTLASAPIDLTSALEGVDLHITDEELVAGLAGTEVFGRALADAGAGEWVEIEMGGVYEDIGGLGPVVDTTVGAGADPQVHRLVRYWPQLFGAPDAAGASAVTAINRN